MLRRDVKWRFYLVFGAEVIYRQSLTVQLVCGGQDGSWRVRALNVVLSDGYCFTKGVGTLIKAQLSPLSNASMIKPDEGIVMEIIFQRAKQVIKMDA